MATTSLDVRKQVWKFQEGAVVVALQVILKGAKKIHWHAGHIPSSMSIEPDVIVGDLNTPEMIFFVTHASAERASEKKFWRGVAEVVEAKRLVSHPRLINILFEGQSKIGLKSLSEDLYDGFVHLADEKYGEKLTGALLNLAESHGTKSKDECLLVLAEEIRKNKVPGFQSFAAQIELAVNGKFGRSHQILCSANFTGGKRLPSARNTALRRGMAKLFTLPGSLVADLSRKNGLVDSVPDHALVLGWFEKHVAGYRLEDEDIRWVLKSRKLDEILTVLGKAASDLPVFVQYANSLIDLEILRIANAWITQNYDNLVIPKKMAAALNRVYQDPIGVLSEVERPSGQANMHWLAASIMSALRTETGRADGYGYSKLGQETGRRKQLNSAPTDFVPYLQLRSDIDSEFRSDIAQVFSGHLKRLGKVRLAELLRQSIDTTAQSIFNYQISGYRHFNPLEWEVCERLDRFGLKYRWPVAHRSFLSNDASGNSSTTGNIIEIPQSKVLIKSQSAYDGRIDKRKELCGRVAAMKMTYRPADLKNIDFILVLDGYFNTQDLSLLGQAGWDRIYYPDEFDDLVTFIKSKSA